MKKVIITDFVEQSKFCFGLRKVILLYRSTRTVSVTSITINFVGINKRFTKRFESSTKFAGKLRNRKSF